ncbi:MAG: tetratricopeptide repeat protein [Planctomycetota bacterium]
MTRPNTLLAFLLLPLALSPGLLSQQTNPTDAKVLRREADAAVQAGDFATAAARFRKLTESTPQDGGAWHMLGYCLHASGKLDEALPIHVKAAGFPAVAPTSSYNVACVHARRGRVDEAFQWLDKAVELGFGDTELLAKDTDLASLRKDPRFAALQKVVTSKAAVATQVFAETTERRSSRVVWFGNGGSPGQVALDYCPVAWQEGIAAAIANGSLRGRKWRLGGDFWTTLDTSIELQFGAVHVPAGYYYLTLEQRDETSYVLALHDAAATKKLRLDPVYADRLVGGLEIPLTHTTKTEKAKQLELELTLRPGTKSDGALAIRYGDHELTTPVTMKVD